MSEAWFVAEDQQSVGPLSLGDLKETLDRSVDWRGRMVWCQGFSQWRQAGSVGEIRELYEPTPLGGSNAEWRPRGSIQAPIVRTVLAVIALAVAAAGGALGLKLIQVMQTPVPLVSEAAKPDLEKELAGAVDGLRTGLPKRIDATTLLTGVRNFKSQLIFENTITSDIAQFDDAKKDKLRQSVIKNICGNVATRKILDIGGSFRYAYTDLQTSPVFAIEVSKAACS